jgi:hypothetical protein
LFKIKLNEEVEEVLFEGNAPPTPTFTDKECKYDSSEKERDYDKYSSTSNSEKKQEVRLSIGKISRSRSPN